ERARVLSRIADLLEANAADLGRLETLDMGMPILMTGGMGPLAAEVFRYWAGMATKLHGLTSPALRPGDFLGYTLREPVGVVGGITPWNAPLLMATWKAAPALACGNTVVLKPAEHTPMTSLELARLTAEAGLPEGVLNVVPGFGPTAGAALASHPGVDKIAFTGEYVTGRLIVQQRKVERYVEIGKKEGAHLRCGGGQPKDPALAKGFYFEPTVFTEVDNKMQIAQEEIFGPVASILKFHDEDDAVRIGNDVIYG